ncbi:MAG: cellulase family glycosylhydrolase [Prevotellaceae bacterium]|nr:cellulase family glycosylhydrolase [Prevotellaceae bacterium]
MKHTLYILFLSFLIVSCGQEQRESGFVTAKDGQFFIGQTPYYYVGVNFWYGAILASTGEGGDRERLAKELDFLQSIGVNNLRILVGADGERGVFTKAEPTLQVAPNVYNDTILDGLDFLMAELGRREMYAVLYLNNSWEWSGGYGQYLEWAGAGKAPIPNIDGWDKYLKFAAQFVQNDSAKRIFADYVDFIVTRTNRYTNIPYTEDKALMSWQIGNEPRAFAEENKDVFAEYILDVAKQIKNLDKNHLVSVGSEGKHGCEEDIALWAKIHSYPEIDYGTFHIWSLNWGWIDSTTIEQNVQLACENTKEYINEHLDILKQYGKPSVLEEFGYPRDNFSFALGTPTTARDIYYRYVFNLISEKKNGFAGCNLWAWGGFAKPAHVFWQKGDDYAGDPAQEQQGLNSVFADDSTVEIIKEANFKFSN